MAHNKHGHITRRALLKAGVALPLVGIAAPNVLSQPLSKSPSKVLDFPTDADVAKAEQEGEFIFYSHDERGRRSPASSRRFNKDFPKIKDKYVRRRPARCSARSSPSARPAGSASTCIQFSDLGTALDFQKRGGYERYVRRQSEPTSPST